jgi:hypothetical protein
MALGPKFPSGNDLPTLRYEQRAIAFHLTTIHEAQTVEGEKPCTYLSSKKRERD